MTPTPRRGSLVRTAALAVGLIVTLAVPEPAAAQFGRGGGRGGPGGGFGGGGNDPLRTLRDDATRTELGLSDDQAAKLDALAEENRDGFAATGEFRTRLQEAETEAEMQTIQAEMAAATRERVEQTREQIAAVLTAEQNERLDQILLQRRGVTALLEDDALAERFGLTDAQRAQMQQVQEDRRAALQERGFAAFRDPEFRAEWDRKTLAVLDPAQTQNWEAATGPDFAPDRDGGDRRRGERRGEPADAAPAAPTAAYEPQAEGQPAARPVDPEKPEGAEAVADIAAKPRTPDDAATGAAGEPVMSFNFRYAPWEDVLMLIANFAGLNLDLEAVPPGTFSYTDPHEYTATGAIDVLNGFLLQRGYVLVRRDNFLISVNIDNGIPPNLVPDVSLEELPGRGTNELVRVVVPLKTGDAAEVVGEAEALLGPQGTATALSSANAIVVRDTGGNVRRVVSLLTELTGGALQFRQFPLKHLDAYDAEILVRAQLGLSVGPEGVAAYTNRDDRGRSSSNSSGPTPNFTADERTNSLLVTATPDQLRIAEEVLQAVDVAEGADGRILGSGSRKPYFQSYALDKGDSREVAKTIDAMFPGTVVNEDGRGDTIHIFASGADQEKIAAMIRQMDGTGGGDTMVSVIPLARMDPASAAMSLMGLFAPDGEDAPVIQPDVFARRLLVRGTPDQVEQVKLLLTQLGEDGSGTAAGGGGPIRTLNLGGRDPQEFLPVLERLWGASRPSPLRVVTPDRPPVIERADPQARDDAADESSAALRLPIGDTPDARGASLGRASFAVQDDLAPPDADEADADPPATANQTSPEPTAGEPTDTKNPVSVSYADGKLILYSEDEAALDDLEELVSRLGEVLPARSQWNLYYLSRVDATETAELLEQLFPTATVSGTGEDGTMMGTLASGVSSFGSSLMDLSGVGGLGMSSQTLRIVPDVAKNALFFTGPPEQVRQVEEVLNVLDGTRPGENLRERVPRMIPVRHADVQEVADLVTEIYKDYTAEGVNQMAQALGKGGNSRGGGGGNPLAMLLGGGAGGNEQPVRLTVGVDTRTSQLIVSAAEPLFEEIEDLVQSLDESARVAKRGVSFVTLRNADAATVQSTLGSLIPQVSSGGSSTVRPSRTTGGSSSSDSNEDSDDRSSAIRQMMMMRALQGRGGGDSGGGPRFGGRGGDAGGRGEDSGGGRGDAGGRGGGDRGGRGGGRGG